MPKPPIIGYVIVRKHASNVGALELCFGWDYPRGGVLLWGDSATMFKGRAACRNSIKRTVRYLNRLGQIGLQTNNSSAEFKIQPVRLIR